jgi:hypothetical protein
LTEIARSCKTCQRMLDVNKAFKEGVSMFEIANSIGFPCASCVYNPGVASMAKIMAMFGKKPIDNWEPLGASP